MTNNKQNSKIAEDGNLIFTTTEDCFYVFIKEDIVELMGYEGTEGNDIKLKKGQNIKIGDEIEGFGIVEEIVDISGWDWNES